MILNQGLPPVNPASVFYYYQKLIRLRHEEPLLTEGEYVLVLEQDPHIFAYLRRSESETWLVAANLSEERLPADTLARYAGERPEFLISNYGRVEMSGDLRPYEAFIARVR